MIWNKELTFISTLHPVNAAENTEKKYFKTLSGEKLTSITIPKGVEISFDTSTFVNKDGFTLEDKDIASWKYDKSVSILKGKNGSWIFRRRD